MKVFISSTSLDLQAHRAAVADSLDRLGQQVGRMEVFGARPNEPMVASLAEIDSCDLVVGIYAHRYGFVPADSEVSITEREFLHASECGKPLFCFLVADDHPWPPKFVEGEPGRAKLLAFKERVGSRVVRDTFTTPEDLALRVGTAVGRHLLEQLTAQLREHMNRAGLGVEELARGRGVSSVPEAARGPILTSLNQLTELMRNLQARDVQWGSAGIESRAVLALAYGLAGRGQWREAAGRYTQYVNLVPGDWLAQFLRGVAFVNIRGGSAENLAGLRSYNEAIAFVPEDVEPNTRARLFAYRGAVLKRLGRLEEAEADLLIARRHAVLDYEVNDVRYNLSAVYALRGDREPMLAALREITDVRTLASVRFHLHDYYAEFQRDPELLRLLAVR